MPDPDQPTPPAGRAAEHDSDAARLKDAPLPPFSGSSGGRGLAGGTPAVDRVARPLDPDDLSATEQADLPVADPHLTEETDPALSGGPAPRGTGAADASAPRVEDSADDVSPAPDPPGVPSDAARPLPAPGQVIAGRYEIREPLGSGGMGAVFAAFDRVRGEELAVKVLVPDLARDARARERFVAEARIASRMAHPRIVRVFDIHQDGEQAFITMERLRGRSLRLEIRRRREAGRPFAPGDVLELAEQLCDALHYAHRTTIHRDVKPENVWIEEDGAVKLMDFGIARVVAASGLTAPGRSIGTAYYMAPEQLRGAEDVDHRADQFATAVVLYEMFTGDIPQGAVRPPHELRRDVPVHVSSAIMTALSPAPHHRHADMSAFWRALSTEVAAPAPAAASSAADPRSYPRTPERPVRDRSHRSSGTASRNPRAGRPPIAVVVVLVVAVAGSGLGVLYSAGLSGIFGARSGSKLFAPPLVVDAPPAGAPQAPVDSTSSPNPAANRPPDPGEVAPEPRRAAAEATIEKHIINLRERLRLTQLIVERMPESRTIRVRGSVLNDAERASVDVALRDEALRSERVDVSNEVRVDPDAVRLLVSRDLAGAGAEGLTVKVSRRKGAAPRKGEETLHVDFVPNAAFPDEAAVQAFVSRFVRDAPRLVTIQEIRR